MQRLLSSTKQSHSEKEKDIMKYHVDSPKEMETYTLVFQLKFQAFQ